MRCDEVRHRFDERWDGVEDGEVQEHLSQCRLCARYARDMALVRMGLRLWKCDSAPEASVGFAERLVRKIGELSDSPSVTEFFERVGKRFVYAALVLTFLALLALAVPSTGPIRGLTAADMPAQEAALAYSDPMGENGLQVAPDSGAGEAPVAAPNEVK